LEAVEEEEEDTILLGGESARARACEEPPAARTHGRGESLLLAREVVLVPS
jgi:hypothetical protein